MILLQLRTLFNKVELLLASIFYGFFFRKTSYLKIYNNKIVINPLNYIGIFQYNQGILICISDICWLTHSVSEKNFFIPFFRGGNCSNVFVKHFCI